MCFEVLTADAIHTREQSKIDAARVTQAARNELKAATASQNAWVQSFSNQRRLRAAGRQAGELAENIGRNLDAATYGRVGERLAASEELGANMASAAAAGVGGSVVDTYNNTIRLSAAMNEEQGDRALRTDLLSSSAMRGDLIANATEGLDNQTFNAGLDYTRYVDHVKMSGLQKIATVVGAAAATYYGGPQAGKAVFDASAAMHAADNGDFEGASAKAASAFQGTILGAKRYSDSGGQSWGGDVWQSVKKRYGANLNIGT
jgi:hypothetical protein